MEMESSDHLERSSDKKFDELLSKYLSVWIWSILFTTTTGVLYSFLSFHLDRWGGLAIVIALPAILALLFALASWAHLYWGLQRFLIPRFVLSGDAELATEVAAGPAPAPPAVVDPPAGEESAVKAQAQVAAFETKPPGGDSLGSARAFGVHLTMAFKYFVMAAGFRAMASLLELVLATVR